MGGQPETIVVAATPTSNGDLHLGHMAGPYLAGDVFARYLRATGTPVLYTTCTDDSQTYVVSTAHRSGVAPESLCADSTAAIQRSLRALGIGMAGLPPVDEAYRRSVLAFVSALYDKGRLRTRTVRLPVASRSGACLYDGLVSGGCPACGAGSCGGACEACGHPNNFDELRDPVSTVDPSDPVTYQEHTILVLPMEPYRDRLTSYFAEHLPNWRPASARLVRDLLARPLPDIPVTMPGTWGIRAPFPETPDQVLYPWVEGVPAVMYSTWWSAARIGDPTPATDSHWRAERGARLVYFHGFDNVFHWGLMDLVLLMAHGDRYVLPEVNVCNEFYELAGAKFSTSRNHLVWTVDLLASVPRDLVRFYLALTAPERRRTAFDRAALDRVVTERLVRPWNALADELAARVGDTRDELPTTPVGRARADGMLARFTHRYDLPECSMSRAAEAVAGQVARLRELAGSGQASTGDLLLAARTLLAGAAPILIDAAETAVRAGVPLALAQAAAPTTVRPFDLPRLPSTTADAPTGADLATVGGKP